MRHNTDFDASNKKKASVSTLKKMLLPIGQQLSPSERWKIILALGCLMFSKILVLTVPLIFKWIIDDLAPQSLSAHHILPLLIMGYALCRISSSFFNELKEVIFSPIAQKAVQKTGLVFFNYLHQQSLQFHLERNTGALIRIFERGRTAVDTILHYLVFSIVPTFFHIIFASIALWWMYNSYIALTAIITVILYAIYSIIISEWRTSFVKEVNKQENLANTQAVDSLLNYETVKYFNNEDHEAIRFNKPLEQGKEAVLKVRRSLSILNFGQATIVACGLMVILWIAARHTQGRIITAGDFVLIHNYILELYIPLNLLGMVYREMKANLINVEEMQLLLQQPKKVLDAPDAIPLNPQSGNIVFDHVSFFYQPERTIIKNINFTVPAGHTVAVVGPSGAGKSTLARLLFRFYDVTEGCISIDGQDIRTITQDSLRNAIGIVPQDTVLFNDTIFYNIQYGYPDASEEEVLEAAKLAQVHAFIMKLPDKYNTMVGERGLRLSGGEKQRVAIARTLLKNPLIFLFDEASSALDTGTEKKIQQNLQKISADRTTLIIAHRLSTIIHAHEILVLSEGQIVERGNHSELLALKGLYAQMWSSQQEKKSLSL